MEPNPATTTTSPDCITKKLMDIFRVVYYMLRKSISKRKLMMDLNSLLKQSKLAGKALTKLLTHHHHHHHSTHSHHHHHSSFSCRSMDPAASFYNPQEVEFSYTPTPQLLPKLRSKNHRNKKHYDVYNYETAAAIAKAFEMLNNNNNNNNNSSSYNINDSQASDDDDRSVLPSPSPLMFGLGKSPIMVRQLRITDSPFPIEEDDKVRDGKVDKEADDFIRRFYEQLKMQKGTPEYNFRRG